ncbi:Prolyl tripeptidyl peptidase precursor [Legionella massiliensis]|uniref:Prolyl tripeptidyl peptidase n=1 Tax=Legionella massiliensis TaxID=1034943 RepID=A0A078L2E4_9GAMM|nr:DPP IV N-terminal domain-containing protein [Legionella massiliensis]CDZ79387.1 Prolyl tripeptidyl peptidase precursor [Legionella massiliensis]CEE15125.1 Prolyl tripeptidyl peptidase precursor [Legionella massiliensis]
MNIDELYRKAEQFLPWNLHKCLFNTTVTPYWTDNALYYFKDTESDKSLIRVDIKTGVKKHILKYDQILNKLFLQIGSNSEKSLSGFIIEESPEEKIFFIHNNHSWCYYIDSDICEHINEITPGHLISPDKNWGLRVKKNNLILRDLINEEEFQLTSDGEPYHNYATSPETNTNAITQRIQGITPDPVAIWSPNSKKIITHRLDQRKVKNLFLLENAPENSQRPKLHSYRMSFSGDEHLPLVKLIIIDIESKLVVSVNAEPLLAPYLTPIEFKWVWWNNNCTKAYFLKETRGAKALMLYEIDAESGDTKLLIDEKAERTYVEPSPHAPWIPQILILNESQKIIWMSQRSGYPHLYLFDKENNTPVQAITQGDWCVRELLFYDDKENLLYFTACGFDKNKDPYHEYLFRCRLNGSEMECLTKEYGNHSIHISPQKHCFLDSYSTINTAPVAALKNMEGYLVTSIEVADIKGLSKLNWMLPKRFCVKARDGVTDIYGNLYFPSHFDSSKEYPIIDHIYPGPQIYRTPSDFNIYSSITSSAWIAQALAELGFIVMQLDGLGTPGRSKHFHDATYKNMGDCSIPDHVIAIKQLASKYDFINKDKTGITGYSGGGYAAMRAMLLYPDFYHVCVSAAGNHDLRCYPANYGEKYNSLDTTTYEDQSNTVLAKNLQGKLLLVHGEMDDNVHPCATMQLVDELITHNKDFELLIMPNQNHKTTPTHPYFIRKTWDFFVRNLLGIEPPKNFLLKEMPNEYRQLLL